MRRIVYVLTLTDEDGTCHAVQGVHRTQESAKRQARAQLEPLIDDELFSEADIVWEEKDGALRLDVAGGQAEYAITRTELWG